MADWSDAFDTLEKQLCAWLVPSPLAAACRMAIVTGREAARSADELRGENAALRTRLREPRPESPAPAFLPPVTSLLRAGDAVLIGQEGARFPGIVDAVILGGPDYAVVKYLVLWWEDKTPRQEWLVASHVEAADDTVPRAAIAYGGITHGR